MSLEAATRAGVVCTTCWEDARYAAMTRGGGMIHHYLRLLGERHEQVSSAPLRYRASCVTDASLPPRPRPPAARLP